jgi:hypothetical protein
MKLRVAALAGLLAATACAPASAAPVTVDLRVEGLRETIFEGRVQTDGHSIEQDAAGPRPCDGTNGGVNSTPGPTMTSALDDAVAWDGTWTESLQDFQIDRIGPDRADSSRFWGYALNFRASELGGCQQQVKAGDDILFAYDFFSKTLLLRLSGPRRAEAGERVRVRVVDGATGNAVRGARVGGRTTDARGYARVRARRSGVLSLKAEHPNGVRSNALSVRVSR